MPFRDPEELLKARVNKLEEEVFAQRKMLESAGGKIDEALALLKTLKDPDGQALAEVEEKLDAAKDETKREEPPPAAKPVTRRRRIMTRLILASIVAGAASLSYMKWWPKAVDDFELAGARLGLQEGAVVDGARVLIANEAAECKYAFLGTGDTLSRIDCEIRTMPDKVDNDAMIDRIVAHFEERLGWPTSGDEDDFQVWKRVDYVWSGSSAELRVYVESMSHLTVALAHESHAKAAQKHKEREQAERHRESVRADRRRREQERRDLKGAD